jgi:hypothetical protein
VIPYPLADGIGREVLIRRTITGEKSGELCQPLRLLSPPSRPESCFSLRGAAFDLFTDAKMISTFAPHPIPYSIVRTSVAVESKCERRAKLRGAKAASGWRNDTEIDSDL